MWYNEEFLAPFFLNHYSWVNKIHIILDVDTNDNTESIAREYQNVEIEYFKFPDMMDDILKVKKLNEKYTSLRNADYVLLVDSDEFIFCNTLEKPVRDHVEETRKDVYFVNLWQIYKHEDDPPLDPNAPIPLQRRRGDPDMEDPFNIRYVKPIVVKGRKNLYWRIGNHELIYNGYSLLWNTRNIGIMRALNVSVERSELLQGSHWRLVELDETIKRRILNRKQRQSRANLTHGLTWHFHHITETKIIQEYNKNRNRPIVIANDGIPSFCQLGDPEKVPFGVKLFALWRSISSTRGEALRWAAAGLFRNLETMFLALPPRFRAMMVDRFFKVGTLLEKAPFGVKLSALWRSIYSSR
jgi:hypothetical protein